MQKRTKLTNGKYIKIGYVAPSIVKQKKSKYPKYNDGTIQLVVKAKCQNAEPIKINGGSNSVFYWIASYSYEVHTKCDWSLKISSLFHWFLIPQTTIGKHVLFKSMQIIVLIAFVK